MRVLIADDHPLVRRAIRTLLAQRENCEVYEASDGAEAIRTTLEIKPDLLILDVMMPVMNGYEAATNLRALAPGVPILFVSANSDPGILEEAKRIGARGFVHKSKLGSALLGAVDRLVARNRTYFPDSTDIQTIAP